MRISDWSSDVCSSDLVLCPLAVLPPLVIPAKAGIRSPSRSGGPPPAARSRGRDAAKRCGLRVHAPRAPPTAAAPAAPSAAAASCPAPAAPAQRRSPPSARCAGQDAARSEEHTSELQSLMRISYAVFCLKKKTHEHQLIRHSEYN